MSVIKKKLLFVIESLGLGGGERSLVTLLNNIDFELFEVDLMLFQLGGLFQKDLPPEVNVIQGGNPKLNIYDRVKYKLCKLLKLGNLHEAQRFWKIANPKTESYLKEYDVAVAYNQQFATYFVASKVLAKLKLAWMNTLYINAGYNANFDLPYFEQIDTLVAVSKEAEDQLIQVFNGLGNLKFTIIQDIIDSKIIQKRSLDPNPFTFQPNVVNLVTVARLAKPKGLDLVIATAKILKEKEFSFNWYIVGEGGERANLENQIVLGGLCDNVFLTGATDNPYPFMKQCDIYVQTSIIEGLGMSVIEASLLCKPIVCTNFETAKSITTSNDIITEHKPEKIASAIFYYVRNPEKKIRASQVIDRIDQYKQESMSRFYQLIQ